MSPGFMVLDGLATTAVAASAPTVTRPFLQLSVAMVRVLNTLMAHSHLSTLSSATAVGLFVVELAHGVAYSRQAEIFYSFYSRFDAGINGLPLFKRECCQHEVRLLTTSETVANAKS